MRNTISQRLQPGQTLSLALLIWFGYTGTAQAAPETLGALMNQVSGEFTSASVMGLITVISYVIGTVFGLQALLASAKHGQQGGKPLSGIAMRYGGAAAFYSLPRAVGTLREIVFGKAQLDGTLQNTVGKGSGATEGLDHALIHMVNDITPALVPLLSVLAFFSGLFMICSGLLHMANANYGQEKAERHQIIARLGVGTALTAFASSVQTIIGTVFGETTMNAQATMAYDASAFDSATNAAAQGVLSAIFLWLALIGLISILRGMWILKNTLEKGSSGLSAPLTHLIAGGMLCNMGPTVHLIEKTLDVPGVT